MWVFLVTEVLFFGGAVRGLRHLSQLVSGRVRGGQPRARHRARQRSTRSVLITSSLTMALAVHAAQTGERRLLMMFLVGDDGAGRRVPRHQGRRVLPRSSPSITCRARRSSSSPSTFSHAQIFFSLYFVMTGLHALHMIIGLGIMTVDAVVGLERHDHARVLPARSRSAGCTGTSSTSSGSSCFRCCI